MKNVKKEIKVVGGGIIGLVIADELIKSGYRVDLYEKHDVLGGLLSGFEMEGSSLERAYHHIFRTDTEIIALIEDLGLGDQLKWYPEKTAIYYDGEIYPFTGIFDLLQFKPLDIISKIRLGLVKIWLEKDNNWKKYEKVKAVEWMKRWCGEKAYSIIWEPLLKGKFHDKHTEISMAWMWARIHTRANSAGKLGYLSGGFGQIVDKLAERIKKSGGEIHLETTYDEVAESDSIVVYTGPSNDVSYIGAIEVVFSSSQKLSEYYWHNVNDLKSPFLAMVLHTNLVGNKMYGNKEIYYLGTYVPHDHRYFGMSDDEIKNDFFGYLRKVYPSFDLKKVGEVKVFKFKNAQHLATVGYKIPDNRMGENKYLVNFAQIYPEDRGINFSVKKAKEFVMKFTSGIKL